MKFLDLFVKAKMRFEIGIGWLYYPRQFALIFIILIWLADRFNYNLNMLKLIFFGLIGLLGVFILGHLDLMYWGVYARQQGFQSGLYNDYFKNKLGKI